MLDYYMYFIMLLFNLRRIVRSVTFPLRRLNNCEEFATADFLEADRPLISANSD
jgi:hypothetical protein